jgi:ABC-type transport system involved in multi-copper enzyme maturation permease subunit
MRTFLTILKDSYREAVDGFVIYVMFALAGVLLAVAASLSFTPAPAEETLPNLVKPFVLFIPDKGQSKAVAAVPGVEFTAQEVKQDGKRVTFKLEAKTLTLPKSGEPDPFRVMVAGWLKKPATTTKMKLPTGSQNRAAPTEKEIELALKPDVTPAEVAAVTDEQMAEFVAAQCHTHIGAAGATAARVADPKPGVYAFDVVLPAATSARAWDQELHLFFGAVRMGKAPLGLTLWIIQDQIVNGIGAGVTLLISVIITAFFIPNLLRKGALDLIVSKPIGRIPLLLYKYVGGCTFIFLLAAFTIGGMWVILGLRSGHWDPRFLIVVPALTFTFALLYAVSTLVAVFTRSAIAAILITVGFAFGLYVVGQAKSWADITRNTQQQNDNIPGYVFDIIDGVNNGLPRYKDLDKLTSKLTADGTLTPIMIRFQELILEYPSAWATIGLSVGYIAVFLALSSWRLVTRDG